MIVKTRREFQMESTQKRFVRRSHRVKQSRIVKMPRSTRKTSGLSSYRTPTRKLRELFLNSRPALIGLECAVVFEDPNGSTLLQDVPTFSKYFAIPLDLCGAHPAQIDPRWRC